MNVLDVVVFTESGEERMVLGLCKSCKRTWEARDAKPEHFSVISPMGTAHVGVDYGFTACGYDATGDKWWWPE